MSSPDTDRPKAKYTVDEMMAVIKNDGEKGSRRRRRSHQPHVISKKKRKFWILMFLAMIVLLGIGLVVFNALNRTRVSGEIFRNAANRHLSDQLGCTVEFDRFRPRDSLSLDCPTLSLTGNGGLFKRGLFTDIESRFTAISLLRNEWDVINLDVENANLSFQSHSPKNPVSDSNAPAAAKAPSDGFRLGLTTEPSFVTIQNLRINRLGVVWPGVGLRENRIEGLRATGSYVGGRLELSAVNGRWIGGMWPEVPVESVSLIYSDEGLKILNARCHIKEKAQIRTSGLIKFTPEGPAGEMEVTMEPTPLRELISPIWQQRIIGKFSPKEATYHIHPDQPDVFAGEFGLDGVIIQGFPGLAALSKFFKHDLYSKLEFRQFSASFRRTNDSLIIDNIEGRRHGDCRLTGSVTLHQNGKLEGKLKLAIRSADANLSQFSGQEEGLSVIDVTLDGTESAPTDDIAARFPAPEGSGSE